MSKTLYKEGVQKIRWCKKEVQKRGTKRGCKEALSNSLFLVSVGGEIKNARREVES